MHSLKLELANLQNIDIGAELAAIRVALEGWTEPTITGGQLASLIRRSAPELDVRALAGVPNGPGALTKFIRLHLSDMLDQIGHQGMDVLHLIKGRTVEVSPSLAPPEIWRTFVSPNSTQRLVLSRATGRLMSRDMPASGSDEELEVAKASPYEHDAIRADFPATLPQAMSELLNSHVAPNANFETWIEALKVNLPEAMPKWGQYRRRRLSELLNNRIVKLQLEGSLQHEILKQIEDSEAVAYAAQKGKKAATDKQAAKPAYEADDATSKARRIAHAAIELLSYEELRALRLPLGAVLDAIQP